ncbi:hypothetical protein T492DRAFT_969375 [Pavlovales sp. CCMP2436]|nr:hypothetical protein T492DRAFT_969375 [Pavlovales sp. CCMP2436]
MAPGPAPRQADDLFEVTVPPGVRAGDAMTVGLPGGKVHKIVVPPGLGPGLHFQIAVPHVEPTALEKVAQAAKVAATAVQKKAKDEAWEAKAKAATKSVLGAGSNFISGFKQGLKGDAQPSQAQPPPAAPDPQYVIAVVPAGLYPGSQMLVATPSGTLQVVVPPGAQPGSEVHHYLQ